MHVQGRQSVNDENFQNACIDEVKKGCDIRIRGEREQRVNAKPSGLGL